MNITTYQETNQKPRKEITMKQLTIKEVIAILQNTLKKSGNLPCVYSIDDEGNAYEKVLFCGTPMNLDKDLEFIDDDETKANVICIN